MRGLRFFATTLYAAGEAPSQADSDLHNVRFESLTLVHPSAGQRLLGEYEHSQPTTLRRRRTDRRVRPNDGLRRRPL